MSNLFEFFDYTSYIYREKSEISYEKIMLRFRYKEITIPLGKNSLSIYFDL